MTMQPINKTYDVVIVGARCAGAATAMLLAALGLRVLVFDKSRFGTDTLSTHALMRPAVLLLQRWGLTDRLDEERTPRIGKTAFVYGEGQKNETVEVDIKPRNGVEALYAPRRTVLDRILVEAARDEGADVRHGVQMVDLLRADSGKVSGVRLRDESGKVHDISAGLVIGADGRRSSVARLAGATPYVWGRHATTCAFGYFEDLPVDGNRWYFRPGMGAGAIPTNHEQTCLFASVLDDFAAGPAADRARAFHQVIEESAPDIAARLPEAKLVGRLRFFPGMRGFLRQPWGDGWALVGDAGYMTDPITAHGITNALRDADILARTVAEGASLADYQLARDDLSLKFFEVSDRVASLDWDIPTVQQYHRLMSQEMGREEEALIAAAAQDTPATAA
ncbi:MAG: NAD(P)/FAD-dependent oxidoreductase [Myxococcales bacterium]|nr:MAG: NAD(P)/FAD-dependent oxidoreductase [Myxococcales bacterium]